MLDQRNKRVVFVPCCSLAPLFQAQGIVSEEAGETYASVIVKLFASHVNIIQMPCPESLYAGDGGGLGRQPHSLIFFDNPSFHNHCRLLAESIVSQILALRESGSDVVCILGVEYSPSCAVALQYTNAGTVKSAGVFIQELKRALTAHELDIPLLGMNRRGRKATLKRLEKMLGSPQPELFCKGLDVPQ